MSHSSEEGLVNNNHQDALKPPKPRRTESQEQVHKVAIGLHQEEVKKSNRSMSFGGDENSAAHMSESDKGGGGNTSDQDQTPLTDGQTPSLSNKRKSQKQQGKDKTPVKQSTQLFDSVRNVASQIPKDLNQSANQDHKSRKD